MMRSRSLRRLIPLALVVLLLPSCGDSADDSSDTTSAPATTTTTAATTTSEVTSTTEATTTTIRVTADTLLLTFDGGSCTYEGLTELTPGPVELVFLNQSEEPAAVNMVSIDEGYTIQDVIADFDTEPATGHHPSWTHELGTWKQTAPGESHRWEGDLEAGLYAMACARLMPLGVWFGTGLTVEQ